MRVMICFHESTDGRVFDANCKSTMVINTPGRIIIALDTLPIHTPQGCIYLGGQRQENIVKVNSYTHKNIARLYSCVSFCTICMLVFLCFDIRRFCCGHEHTRRCNEATREKTVYSCQFLIGLLATCRLMNVSNLRGKVSIDPASTTCLLSFFHSSTTLYEPVYPYFLAKPYFIQLTPITAGSNVFISVEYFDYVRFFIPLNSYFII